MRCRRYSGNDNVTEQIRRSADTVVLLHCPKCPLKAPRGAAIAVLLIESVMLFLCVVKPISTTNTPNEQAHEHPAGDGQTPAEVQACATPISFHSSMFPLFNFASNSPINFSNSAFLSGSPVVRASTPRNAKIWAVSNASLAGTCTSGFTPTPS